MQYYFAPLEGVTGSEFRRAHTTAGSRSGRLLYALSSHAGSCLYPAGAAATSCRSTTRAFGRCLSF